MRGVCSMKNYFLMNKDKPMGVVGVRDSSIEIQMLSQEFPSIIHNVENWINNQSFYVDRKNIINMAKIAGIRGYTEFIDKIMAISITDTFWYKDIDSNIKWAEISPYRNKLNLVASRLALDGGLTDDIKAINTPSPQYMICGTAEKSVKRVNGKIRLYKTDGIKQIEAESNRQYSEYYASLIGDMLGISNKVNYDIKIKDIDNKGTKAYSICDIFTSENESLLEAEHTEFNKKDIDYILKRLDRKSIKNIGEMLVLDSITLNYDRHYGNFGFMYDTDTFKVTRMAPIYDNDCSLLTHIQVSGVAFDKAYDEALDMMEYMDKPVDYIAVNNMTPNMEKRLYEINGKIKVPRLKGMSELRRKYIEKMVNLRVAEILKVCK